MDRVLIVGCGDIGRRVARLWGARGAAVFGLSRSPGGAGRVSRCVVVPVKADLDDRATLGALPTRGALVYYFAPPPAEGSTDPRARAFADAVPRGDEPEKLVYMSTTGVYGDLKGGWATEETPAVPETDRGRRRLDAENVLFAWGRERSVPVVVLRVAGIYGPGRIPVEAIRRGTPVLDEAQSPFTNRIHADDLARVCVAAAERAPGGRIYNVSDGIPGTITEYFHAVADRLGLPRAPTAGLEEARKVLSQGLLSYLCESRRIDCRRMREELGVALRYPTLAEGLAASLEDDASVRQEEHMSEQGKITLVITGMTCGHCVAATTKSLAAVPGVSDVAVTLDPPRAVVTYDPAKADVRRLEAAVAEAGYAASAPGGAGG